jgi:hypothetical protein
LHVGSRLPSGGRPHAILRSQQKVQARLGRRGSCALLDALVLALLVALGGEVFTAARSESDGTGSGAGSGFRPIAVNGGPSSLRAYGLSLVSSDRVLVLALVIGGLSLISLGTL